MKPEDIAKLKRVYQDIKKVEDVESFGFWDGHKKLRFESGNKFCKDFSLSDQQIEYFAAACVGPEIWVLRAFANIHLEIEVPADDWALYNGKLTS